MAKQKRNDCIEFGKAVQIRMIELEMTQKELAQLIGTCPQYVYFITSGKKPGLKHREKIRSVLGMPSVRESISKNIESNNR